jgi:hypothetical protein
MLEPALAGALALTARSAADAFWMRPTAPARAAHSVTRFMTPPCANLDPPILFVPLDYLSLQH